VFSKIAFNVGQFSKNAVICCEKKNFKCQVCCHFKADIPLQFKHLVLKPSACWRPAESLQQLADVQVQLLHVEGFDQTLNNPNWLNLEEMTPFTKEHLIVLVLES